MQPHLECCHLKMFGLSANEHKLSNDQLFKPTLIVSIDRLIDVHENWFKNYLVFYCLCTATTYC